MTGDMDVGGLLDAWAISKLKAERIGNINTQQAFRHWEGLLCKARRRYPDFEWDAFCAIFLQVHDAIWQLEAGLKSGKERLPDPHYILDDANNPYLVKIGAAALIVRSYNGLRVSLKNLANRIAGTGFVEVKKDHLSA